MFYISEPTVVSNLAHPHHNIDVNPVCSGINDVCDLRRNQI